MGSETSRRDGSMSIAGALGRLRAYLCGDRYMVGAYPPEWQGATPAEHPAPAIPGDAAAPAPDVIPLRPAVSGQAG